jgi:hypothetical protein
LFGAAAAFRLRGPSCAAKTHGFGVCAPDSRLHLLTGSPGAVSIPEQEDAMEDNKKEHRLSLDWWTVILAFTLTALVLLGLPAIPW